MPPPERARSFSKMIEAERARDDDAQIGAARNDGPDRMRLCGEADIVASNTDLDPSWIGRRWYADIL